MAAGAFLVSLVLSAYGRIGNMRFRVSSGAVNLARELGLVLFLAGAGVSAGAQFVQVFEKVGPSVLLVGFLVTTTTMIVAVVLMSRFLKLTLLTTNGALAGVMTNPPALNAAKSQSVTDVPTLAYATIFPFAMLLKIVLIQVVLVVMGIGVS
jgi:putative transport protein